MTDRPPVNNFVPSVAERASTVRPRVAAAARELGVRETARRIGVSHTAVGNFVSGATPQESVLEKYERWVATQGIEETPTGDEADAETLFEHFEGLVRRMGGEGVAPEELRLRKLDVIEGLKRLYGAAGGVPGWVYRLAANVAAEQGTRPLDAELDEDVRRLNQALGDEGGERGGRRGAGGAS